MGNVRGKKNKRRNRKNADPIEIPKESIEFLLSTNLADNLSIPEDQVAFDYNSFSLVSSNKGGLIEKEKNKHNKKKNKGGDLKFEDRSHSAHAVGKQKIAKKELRGIFNSIDIDVDFSDDDTSSGEDEVFEQSHLLSSGRLPQARKNIGNNDLSSVVHQVDRITIPTSSKIPPIKCDKPEILDVAKYIDDKLNEPVINLNVVDEDNRYKPRENPVFKKLGEKNKPNNKEQLLAIKKKEQKEKKKAKLKEKKKKEKENLEKIESESTTKSEKDFKEIITKESGKELVKSKKSKKKEKGNVEKTESEAGQSSNSVDADLNELFEFLTTIDVRLYKEPLNSEFNQSVALAANPLLKVILRVLLSNESLLAKPHVRANFFMFLIKLVSERESPVKVFQSPEFSQISFLKNLDDLKVKANNTEEKSPEELLNFDALKYLGFITLWIIHIVKLSNPLQRTSLNSFRRFFASPQLRNYDLRNHQQYLPHIWALRELSSGAIHDRIGQLQQKFVYDPQAFVLILRCLRIRFDSLGSQ